ncbi:hypothetical protein MUN89_05975 [Halobacillus salinarum]|uniref:Uncharacterized protein n=1 Tax=Halobacillus salinarum TaxID=2932257 RepID=A0ABY4ENG9_9BACI|nr:hypothetical protein [Halobacillus salinarum]UOQ45492.1 hypothetical protein MUN89_05975 [Halobacillus salinarum]
MIVLENIAGVLIVLAILSGAFLLMYIGIKGIYKLYKPSPSNQKCPKCKNSDWKYGNIKDSIGVAGDQGNQFSTVRTQFCANCGYIAEWYVNSPEKLNGVQFDKKN